MMIVMPRLTWPNLLTKGFCVSMLIVSVGAAQPVSNDASAFSSLTSQVARGANSIWNYLFPRCAGSVRLGHLDKSSELAVGEQKSRMRGKLGYGVPSFSQIDCEGGLSILLDPKGPEGKIQAVGSDVNAMDSGNVLYLRGARGKSTYDVVISGKALVSKINKVNLYDACSLSGQGLKQSSWTLNSETTGDVVLRGMFDHCAVMQKRENIIDMYWVGSSDIDVAAKSGVMRLSGSVDRARLRFSGDSQVLLNHLRTNHGWLDAGGRAYVEVFGDARWSVFTRDHAQVLADGVPVYESATERGNSVAVVND